MLNKYKIIVLIIITLMAVVWGVAAPFYVSGDCMEPAVKDGSYVFVNRIAPYLRKYRINDIVAVNYENKVWIARIL